MRLAPTALIVFLLASCGGPAEPENEAGGVTAANEAAAPANAPAESPAPAPVVAEGIPEAFRGIYDENEESCRRPSEYRLTVGAGELRFHESIGTVRRVKVESPTRIEVLADYQGEGESWQNLRTLELDGKRLTISGEGTEIVRLRCPDRTPA